MKREYDLSFRCFYGAENSTTHRQRMPLKNIPKWLEAYIFTHPNVESITVKVWPHDTEGQD